MDTVTAAAMASGLGFGADGWLDWIERKRGGGLENRQVVFFAIILSLALVTFWLVRISSAL